MAAKKKKQAKVKPKATPPKPPVRKKRLATGARKNVRKDIVDAAVGKAGAPEVNSNRVDARRKRGKGATKTLSEAEMEQTRRENAAREKVYPRKNGIECMRCARLLNQNVYSQLTRNPVSYDSVCLACRATEEAEDLRAEVLERGAARNIKQKDVRAGITKQRKARAAAREREGDKRRAETRRKTREALSVNEAAARELARRELLKRKLLYFVHAFHPDYQAGWVHSDICARLERFYQDVVDGNYPRLMLFCPPRHGKSALASKLFPAWCFGQNPKLNIIATSYGVTLPTDFSRYVRARMGEELYTNTFPESALDPKKTNVENWGLQAGGEYIAGGVGTGISGRGADILIVDDPFKDAADADSETVRRTVWDWFKSTAYSRLSPNGGVLVIMTRWHDDDLAGALEQEELELVQDAESYYDAEIDALTDQYRTYHAIPDTKLLAVEAERDKQLDNMDRWEVVSYPAIADKDEYRMPDGKIVATDEPGAVLLRRKDEALHEQRWPHHRLMRIYNGYKRRNMRHWHALYQQKPVPDEGEYFTKDMFHERDVPPSYIWRQWTVLQAWDLAIGLKQQHNYTVGITGVLDPDDVLWVLNVVRGRWDIDGIANQVLDAYDRYRPARIGVERGPLELALMPAVKRLMNQRNKALRPGQNKLTPYFLSGKHALTPILDKDIRARPLQGLMQQGAWVWAKGSPWLDNVKHEMVRFPSGVLDDCVDAAAWLAHVAVKTPAPRDEATREAWLNNRDKKGWRDRLSAHIGRSGNGSHMGA